MMYRICSVLFTLFLVFIFNNGYSQGIIVYDFSLKAMPGWIWGGVDMKYSHSEDNKENGFAEIKSKNIIKGSGYIGKIVLKDSHLFTAGNYINIMLKGAKNDVSVIVQILYDNNNDNLFDINSDMKLVSKPVSIDFDGWKEVKIKLDQENFKLESKLKENNEITEENVYGVQIDFEAGKNYKESIFESGIALISEIPNKEVFSDFDSGNSSSKESYFSANNNPNPFKTNTSIIYTLPQPTYVTITVYDRLGRQVEVLIDQNQESGEHSVDFSAAELPSGIYFYRIKTPEKTEVRKMLLAK